MNNFDKRLCITQRSLDPVGLDGASGSSVPAIECKTDMATKIFKVKCAQIYISQARK